MTNGLPQNKADGLPLALGAYAIWGLLPLYFYFLLFVPPLELIGWRVIFTLPVCLLVVIVRRQGQQLRLALTNPKVLLYLITSATLIGANWLVYIYAVQSGHVLSASLGYYINPLLNVLLGTVFLRERLTRQQWIAVAMATVGVAILAFGALDTLWISLTLAFSFGTYGLVRKLAPVESLPGLTIETLIWTPFAIAIVGWYAGSAEGSAMHHGWISALMIVGTGIMTAAPLLLFASAARRMDYSLLGFVQFLAPTMVFFIGLFVFEERLQIVQLACFLLIWTAIALFSWDLFARRRIQPATG